MSTLTKIQEVIRQAREELSPDLLIIILGPTASGKTKLAVKLASEINGEIISADSRQVYRGMDIGTGKDLEEYLDIPHHLINIQNPGDKYNVDFFRSDFFEAYDHVVNHQKQPILCGGSGSYIQSVLQHSPYAQIPKNSYLQKELARLDKEQLIAAIQKTGVPQSLKIDFDNHKRLVRALEILLYLPQLQNQTLLPQRVVENYLVFGLAPPLERRRASITQRLKERLQRGLIEEVKELVEKGVSYNHLIYYGLEYKYVSLYLQGSLTYPEFFDKLNTEIHRYAKRQMTYFRKMEKNGIKIHWL